MALTKVQSGMIGSVDATTLTGIVPAANGGTGGTNGAIGFKNRLINGNFLIWQRGTSSSSAGYLADRWQLENAGTYSQSSDVPSGQGFPYSCTVSVTSGTAYGVIKQKIEAANCTDTVGQSVTVSFWVKNLTGDPAMYAILYYANSADNFGSVTAISTQTFTAVLNTWTKFTFTWNSLPAGAANGLQIYVFSADGAVAPSYRFTGAQREVGTAATNFDVRSIGTELGLCQRYCWKYGGTNSPQYLNGPGLYADGNTIIFGSIPNPVPMRIAASLTVVGAPSVANNGAVSSGWTPTISGPGGVLNSWIDMTKSGHGVTAGVTTNIYCSTSSIYFLFTAEL